MNRKSIFQIGISILFITLIGILWAVQMKSRSAVANEQHLVHLPIISTPLCDFPDYTAGGFFESEPNGTLSKANGPVPPGVTAHGCFSNPSDINDAYYFYLTERSDIEVNLTDISAGQNYELALYFVDQIVIATSQNPGNQDEHIILADQPPGKYYVQIYNASQTVSKQTYELTVNYTVINECDHLAVIEEIFPQLKDKPGAFPFYAKNSAFQCHLVFNRLHSGLFSLHMEYSAGPEDGYWGVATPMGYDASQYSKTCVWVYAETVPQSFTINLKDLAGVEKPSPTQSISVANTWQQFCIFLSQYEAPGIDIQGVNIEQLESVNIHFSQATGDANIWVDGFEFAGNACDHPALTEDLFPQLKEEHGQFPFYSKIVPFQCEVSFDPVYSEPVSLHMKYTADILDGYWGVATPHGYDASHYDAICLWAYGLDPLQSFMVNLRDITKTEKSSSVQNLLKRDEWTEFCIPLSQYDGVQLDQLENVNIHFSQGTGDVDIWVDDFEYR